MNSVIYKKLWFLLFANAIFFIVLSIILPIRFEKNDDPLMLMIASGSYSGTPDAHLVFINYIYGLFVVFLYTHIKGIEWYSVLFSLVHIFSLTIISWKIINANKPKIRKYLFLLFFYLAEISIILFFQFTTTAAICALAGILLFISGGYFQKIVGILLFTLASLIRFDAAFLVLVVSSPIFLYEITQLWKTPKFKFLLLLMSLFILLPVGFKTIDKAIYNSNENWKYYKQYNYYRGAINDNPNAHNISLPLAVTEIDYGLFHYFFVDSNIFTLDVLENIYSTVKHSTITEKIVNIYPNSNGYRLYASLIFIFTLIQFFLVKDKINRIVLLLVSLLFLLTMLYISLEAQMKFRVFMSALLAFTGSLFFLEEKKVKLRYRYLMYPFFIVFLFFFIKNVYNTRCSENNKVESIIAQQNELFKSLDTFENCDIVVFFDGVKFEYYSPFDISNNINNHSILCSGWLSSIPFNRGRFDSFLDIIDKNVIYLEKRYEKDAFVLIPQSIKEHYNIDVEIEVIKETADFELFKIRSINKIKI